MGNKQNALVTNYEYDIIGQLSRAINPTAKVRLDYDALGRITEERTAILGLEEARVLSHEYDDLGNRVKTTLPTKQTIEWEYNEIQQLEKISLDGKEVSSYQRDALNQELSRTQGALETLNEYDSLGRLISQNVYNKEQLHNVNILNDEAKQQSRNYSYSKVGELLSIDDSRKGKTNYSYDRLGRVKETIKQNASNETKELFAFDPAHNLLNDENDQALKNNQIETYQDKRFKYDTFGNLTNKKISNHTNMDLSYDAQNQLNTAKVTKNKITQTYHYTYDPFGRRVTKTDTFGTTYFTWDGNRLLTETRGDTDQSYIYEQFGFTPIASTNKQNELHYYHSDHLGTPQEITNNQGEIVWEAEYATWGNTTKVTYKQIDANIEEEVAFQPLRFQGQYYDQETGFHYNRFRYYDPDIGRFISQDPIGLLGGTNLYQYAPNPVGWVDPLGLVNKNRIVSNADTSKINFSQAYVEDSTHIQKMTNLMREGKFDWNRSPLDVQIIDGQMVSGDNRRLVAAKLAGVEPSIVIRDANEPFEKDGVVDKNGATFGSNLKKKLNSKPNKSSLPKINTGKTGTSEMPMVVDKKDGKKVEVGKANEVITCPIK